MTQQPDATPKVVAGSDQAAAEADLPPSKQKNNPARSAETAKSRDEETQAAETARDRAARLEAELAETREQARAEAGDAVVRLRVEEPHAEFYHGGVGVGPDWTVVPEHMVPALMEGAANSGVTLTQEVTEES
jgi:hypothetical protein